MLDDVHPDDIIENLNYHASSTSEYAIISAGNWMCKESILFVDYDAPEPWPESLSEISLSFSSAGQSFSRIYADLKLGSLATYLYYGSTPVYCYGDGVDAAGWLKNQYGSIVINSYQIVDRTSYKWFTDSFTFSSIASADPVKTTVEIYDSTGLILLDSYVFKGSVSSTVTVNVSSDDVVISAGSSSYHWTPPLDFIGFGLSGTIASIVPGQTWTYPGGANVDQTIKLWCASTLPPEHYFIIDLYSFDGSKLLDSYSVPEPYGKTIDLQCTKSGLQVLADDELLWSYLLA